MTDFLPLFKPNRHNKPLSIKGKKDGIFFLIDFDEDGAYMEIVDAKGQPARPDYRLFGGSEMNVIRLADDILRKQEMNFSWETGNTQGRIHLGEYPYMMYELLMTHCLVTRDMKRVSVWKEPARLVLQLQDTANDQVVSRMTARCNDSEFGDFQFITDSFILAGKTIFPVAPAGSNYRMKDVFNTTFDAPMTDRFLSVFFSYVSNVTPEYKDYEVEYADNDVEAVPTLVIEKVDADKSLYMEIRQTVPGIEMDFFRRFDLIYIATLTTDHKIRLRRISYNPVEQEAEELLGMMQRSAPRTLRKDIYYEDNLFILPQTVAGPFLLKNLPALIGSYRLLGAEKLKEYKVVAAIPKLNANLASGIDFLEGSIEISLGNQVFSLGDFLKQYNKNRYVSLNDGNRALVDADYVKRLERIFRRTKGKEVFKVSFFDLPEVEALMQERMKGEAFVRHRQIYEGFNTISSSKISLKKVNAEMRPYQVEGVKWMNYLYKNNLGGCLADDMGLGKTLQTIALLTLIYPKEKTPSLIVMPRSLIFNWQNELQKFAPQLDVYTYYAATRDMKEVKKSQVTLTTYAMVRNDVKAFAKEKFNLVVLDESQNIKNVTAQTTQAVNLLQTKHRMALSGTPIENNLTELYSLFRFLNPAMFGSIDDFNRLYTYPIQKADDKEAMKSLRARINPFMLRRLKKDVLKDLPDKIDQTLYVDMSNEQATFYEQRRRAFYDQVHNSISRDGIAKSQFIMFQALNELRRIASVPESMSDGRIRGPKLDTLIDTLSDAVSNGHKVVVFFNYIAGLEIIGEMLDERGIDYVSMTGSTRDRKTLVDRFQNDDKCKIFLMTLKTGGVGLNLVAADIVFIFEPWWNKAAEEQAVNRLYRIGQKHKVLSYSIITRNTIEEKILLLQQQKASLVEGIINNDSSTVKQLSAEDIEFILG